MKNPGLGEIDGLSTSGPTPLIESLGVVTLLVLLLVPILFFLLFYYYLSQLVGINDSLEPIVELLEQKWLPDKEKNVAADIEEPQRFMAIELNPRPIF